MDAARFVGIEGIAAQLDVTIRMPARQLGVRAAVEVALVVVGLCAPPRARRRGARHGQGAENVEQDAWRRMALCKGRAVQRTLQAVVRRLFWRSACFYPCCSCGGGGR